MESKIIPFGAGKSKKKKQFYDIGEDFGKYTAGAQDFGGDFFGYVTKAKQRVPDTGNFLSYLPNMDIGGDYMKYIESSTEKKLYGYDRNDYMSYIDMGNVPAFKLRKGKMTKKEKLARFAPKEMESAYGLESVGLALSESETSFGKFGDTAYQRGQNLGQEIGHAKKIVKEDYMKLKEKVRKYSAKKRIKKDLLSQVETSEPQKPMVGTRTHIMTGEKIQNLKTKQSYLSDEEREKSR